LGLQGREVSFDESGGGLEKRDSKIRPEHRNRKSMSSYPKILFLGHDGSRSGAPLLLLELISWLKNNSELRMELLLKSGGPLEAAYSKQVQTDFWCDKIRQYNFGFMRSWLRRARLVKWQDPNWNALYPVEEYPLVYANTVVTLDEALRFRDARRSIILHVHEMKESVEHYSMRDILKASALQIDCFIAASRAVESYLIKDIGLPKEKVIVVHEFAVSDSKTGIHRHEARKRLGLTEENFVIGMCGAVSWRKGVDFFIRLAQVLKTKDSLNQIRLLWLGGNHAEHRQSLHELTQFGLTGICRFIEASDNPSDFYPALDVFALTSREDPFSVAMLEAGLAGLPIICFEGAGGGAEFVEQDAGICVPYGNVVKMAEACLILLGNESKRSSFGICAQKKVIENYSINKQASKILNIIQEFI
jgi:glycosyltransferase involved in cell wall biosynthesis